MSIGKGIAIASMWIGISIAIAVTGNANIAGAYSVAMFATIMLVLLD